MELYSGMTGRSFETRAMKNKRDLSGLRVHEVLGESSLKKKRLH